MSAKGSKDFYKLNAPIFDKRFKSTDAPSQAQRVPYFSRPHNIVPHLYVPEWKNDMQNRRLITENAEMGSVPHHEHDDNLFLEKREQMTYNVEARSRVDGKYALPDRYTALRPPFSHHTSRYQSELMCRRDDANLSAEMQQLA